MRNEKAWKGSLVELRVVTKLIELGYPVYSPFIQNGQADCIIETVDGFKRIQIKTARKKMKNYDHFFAQIRSKNSGKNYSEYEIDFIICENNQRFFVLSTDDFRGINKFEISIKQFEGKWNVIPAPVIR